MSLQRAVVNCRECYELRRSCPKDTLGWRAYAHYVRNEAMKALEDSKPYNNARPIPGVINDGHCQTLTACINCDFSEPKIAMAFAAAKRWPER